MDGQNKKISFLLYVEWREQLEMLSDEECGKLIKALLAYVSDGTKPELSGAANMAFAFIRAQLDRDLEKWEDKCQKRSDAGKKGGLARASKAKQTSSKSKQSQATLSNAKQSQANQADKEKEKENENENEKEKESYISAEPEADSTPIIELPLNDGTMFPISQEQCQEWAGLYPAVNVIQQLRQMRGWLDANPTKRKTKRGINRFITGWLARTQDKGGDKHHGTTIQSAYPELAERI